MQTCPRSSSGSRRRMGASTPVSIRSASARSFETQVHIVARPFGKPAAVAASILPGRAQAGRARLRSAPAWCCRRTRASRRPPGRPWRGRRDEPQLPIHSGTLPAGRGSQLDLAGHAVDSARPPVAGRRRAARAARAAPRPGAASAPRRGCRGRRSRARTSPARRAAMRRPPEIRSIAASVFASGTGPRRTASETVVARAMSPERSIMLASAVGPSSQGVWKTKWSFAQQRGEPALPRRVDRAAKAFLRKRLLAELHQRQMDAQLHRAMLPGAYSSRPIFARYSVSVAPPIAVRTDSLKRSVRRSGRKRRSARACLRGLRSP